MSQIQPLKDAASGLEHSLCLQDCLKVTGRCVWLWMALNFVGQKFSKIRAVKDPSLVSFMAWETKDAFWGCIWRSLWIGTNLIVLLWSIQSSKATFEGCRFGVTTKLMSSGLLEIYRQMCLIREGTKLCKTVVHQNLKFQVCFPRFDMCISQLAAMIQNTILVYWKKHEASARIRSAY